MRNIDAITTHNDHKVFIPWLPNHGTGAGDEGHPGQPSWHCGS